MNRNGRHKIFVSYIFVNLFALFYGDYEVPLPWVAKHASTKGKCSFKDIGYKPSGGITKVKKLVAPVAKLQKTLIDKIAGKSSMSANLLMHSVNAGKTFTTVTETSMKAVKFLVNLAPKLASTLGIFGAVFAFASDATKPSAQQIIDSTNVAFENLTVEMNNRINQLQGYIDSRVIQLEKAMVTRELKVMQNIWLNCADELIDTDTINECQRDAARFVRANKPKFLLFGDKKTANKTLDSYTIRRAEASLFAFREFANLCIMVGETVAGSYEIDIKDDITSRKYFIRYIQRLIDDIVEFKAHATWILSEIIRVHTKGSCETTIRCGKKTAIKEGFSIFKVHTADKAWCRCLFDPTLDQSATCDAHIVERADGKQPDGYEKVDIVPGKTVMESKALKVLSEDLGQAYIQEAEKFIRQFWQNELFTLFDEWDAALEKAKERKAEALRIDKEGQSRHKVHFHREEKQPEDKYSIRFKQRLKKAKKVL